ncbi:MAG TPA: DUF5678 domain-containing protein [Blastocatellia bacterium]|nr:DUF5678 domain-containing protein [Blastocatellia bacterium]
MSGDQLMALKEQLARLTPREKLEVARFLEEDAARDLSPRGAEPCSEPVNDQKRARRLAWLKAHREEYAGRYVALDGDRLVGSGATIREAHDEAISRGVAHPFLTHISSASDAPFGGW